MLGACVVLHALLGGHSSLAKPHHLVSIHLLTLIPGAWDHTMNYVFDPEYEPCNVALAVSITCRCQLVKKSGHIESGCCHTVPHLQKEWALPGKTMPATAIMNLFWHQPDSTECMYNLKDCT